MIKKLREIWEYIKRETAINEYEMTAEEREDRRWWQAIR